MTRQAAASATQPALWNHLARIRAAADVLEGGAGEGALRGVAAQVALPGRLVNEALEELGDQLGNRRKDVHSATGQVGSQRQSEDYYAPSPADDLYALGVTAYRLVMGQYPGRMEARGDEQGCWQVPSPDLRPLLESHGQVEPQLRQVLVRLLSEAPEARGTARQVAEALEALSGETGEAEERASWPEAVERPRARKRWLAVAAAGACAVGLWNWQREPRPPVHMASSTQQTSDAQAPEAGTAALGGSSSPKSQDTTSPAPDKSPLAQSIPPEPRPGQAQPDRKGRCPGPEQVPINGGCWLEFPSMSAERCTDNGNVLFKGKCYVPAFGPAQKTPPTSSPAEAR
ncbi:MAG TPA: hypothetical protein VK539_10525 [Myxococcaceae bacterium]|nr:hypothetical protein [Myxococcaceae bacterium]